MEFPYGHTTTHHHHHHHRRDQDDDGDDNRQRPNYPPPGTHYSSFDQPPPPPPPTSSHFPHDSPATHVHHSSHQSPYEDHSFPPPPPPPPSFDHRPPPFDSFDHRPDYGASTNVLHVGHHFEQPPPIEEPGFHGDHHSRPHLPSFLPHHSDKTHQQGSQSELYGKRTVKVFTKAEPNYSLTIRDGKVILAKSNPSDDFQHWYKDEKYSTRVKDEEGFPCFALVNKATGQAMKHSVGATHPVQLIPYNSNVLDESILWTEGKDLGDGFRPVRMVNNIRLNVDAFHGDKHSGGVHDGTTIVLWQWNKGDNQRWRITPY